LPGGPYIALVFAGSIVSTSELIAITRTLPSSALNRPAAHAPATAAITSMTTITTAHNILLFGRAGEPAGCAISLSGCFSELPTYFPPLRQDTGSTRETSLHVQFPLGVRSCFYGLQDCGYPYIRESLQPKTYHV